MKENEIKINKTYLKGNESYINVDLTYNNSNKDITKEINILDRCMNRLTINANTYEAVSIIRTIFREYNEKVLKIVFVNGKDINSLVKYKDNKLVKYSSTNELDKDYKMLFDYSSNYGIRINFVGSLDPFKNSPTKEFDNEYRMLNKLGNDPKTFIKSLNFNELYIAKLYETLYNKKIDFNKENMPNILTSSLFLLQEALINLPEDIYFCMSKNNIYSYNLYDYISKLMLFDDIDTSKYNLSKDGIKLIENISVLLKDNEEKVPKIASLIYNEKYRMHNRNNESIEEKIKKLTK